MLQQQTNTGKHGKKRKKKTSSEMQADFLELSIHLSIQPGLKETYLYKTKEYVY